MEKKQSVLRLTLKKEWFDMILSGEKKEEYRDIKDYWRARLEETPRYPFEFNPKHFDLVEFTNGYGSDKPRIVVQCFGIELGESKPEWCGGVQDYFYVIHLGEILERHNIKSER